MQDQYLEPGNNKLEFPLQFQISFEKVVEAILPHVNNSSHPYYNYAKTIEACLKKTPELKNGVSLSSLIKYQEEIETILEPVFPPILSGNEIKAAGVPFLFHFFKFSSSLDSILKNTGGDYQLKIREMQDDKLYIHACILILNIYYGHNISFNGSFYFDIPDETTRRINKFRLTIDSGFSEIIPGKNVPEITGEDYKNLINNIDNIDFWKEKFPPGSYLFKGFSLFHFYDFTDDQALVDLRDNLLTNKDDEITIIEKSLQNFLKIDDLKLGYSVFNLAYQNKQGYSLETKQSLVLDEPEQDFKTFFPPEIATAVFQEKRINTISDMNEYGTDKQNNAFFQSTVKNNIKSMILMPVELSPNSQLAIFEIASSKPYELNPIIQHRLNHIRPALEASIERIVKRFETGVELAIQQECTSIHPSVRWKFRETAIKFLRDKERKSNRASFGKIVFKNVYPLYGQTDVKSSSEKRNEANSRDLVSQLKLVKDILLKSKKSANNDELSQNLSRTEEFIEEIQTEFRVDTEAVVLKFIKEKIEPVFKVQLENGVPFAKDIENYFNELDTDLGTIYNYRKNYDNTITIINKKIAAILDYKQIEAQQLYPHFFERFKTDGVEHSMYIGESIAGNKPFDKKHLHNLRLWQLQVICQTENEFYNNKEKYPLLLKVASMIFVFNKPINIRFINDEKQFDVDGTYNARYEIIKKRIDKAKVKGTEKRVTEPGCLSIIYSNVEDEKEYLAYISLLQSKNILTGKYEIVEIEDLQDVTGLKAIKAGIVYHEHDKNNSNYYYYDELVKETGFTSQQETQL
ncbi:MAG TPA: hypothetical protein VKA10_01430 [Prolixibacteraceae bacterium]|nr:hypothetical protein [Prolixibacteraceae bacterium]